MKVSTILKSLALAVTLVTPFAANAESTLQTTCAPCTANARVDFSIVIPKILFLRVGAAGGGIDQITFTVPAANVGNAVAQAGVGGDLGTGSVTAIVQGNNGTVTLTATNGGALTNGVTAGTIDYSEIVTTPSALGGFATLLNAPVLGNLTSSTVTINPAPSLIVNSGARWTYTYANTNVVEPGTYGGVNANNSRVTYTASMP
jgi:hypothetical protein